MLQTNHQDKYMVRADRCLGHGLDGGGWRVEGVGGQQFLASWVIYVPLDYSLIFSDHCIFIVFQVFNLSERRYDISKLNHQVQ